MCRLKILADSQVILKSKNMMRSITYVLFSAFILFTFSCKKDTKNSYWGNGTPFFEVQKVFFDERFPNVVVATFGTVVASWSSENFRVRRSEDEGVTCKNISVS
jgi:hypothetical protein